MGEGEAPVMSTQNLQQSTFQMEQLNQVSSTSWFVERLMAAA